MPPSIAPARLPKPPMTAAVIARFPIELPIEKLTEYMGPISTPDTAARHAAIMYVAVIMVVIFTPIRDAAFLFIETALIAIPVLVFFIKITRAIISAEQMLIVQRFCGETARVSPINGIWIA